MSCFRQMKQICEIKIKRLPSLLKFLVPAKKDEAVNKPVFSSDENNFSLAINYFLKTFITSITFHQSTSLKRH